MNPRYIFKLSYYAPKSGKGNKGTEIEVIETVVAETIQQALEYWRLHMMDEAIKFRYIVREDSVLAILPQPRLSRG